MIACKCAKLKLRNAPARRTKARVRSRARPLATQNDAERRSTMFTVCCDTDPVDQLHLQWHDDVIRIHCDSGNNSAIIVCTHYGVCEAADVT